MQYFIQPRDIGKRLDVVLHGALPEYSRSQIQQAVKNGEVLVNEKSVRPSYKMRDGDVVTGDVSVSAATHMEPVADVAVDILRETEHLVFINKPVGLVVHPGDGIREPTLAHGLLARYPEIKDVGESDIRPGIVHRLDRETSGVMVIARDTETYHALKEAWIKHQVRKTYIAVVHGILSEKAGSLESHIRFAVDHHKMVSEARGIGKAATSFYEVIDEVQHYSLVKIMPKTGRTHQIRVQFSSIGHPVVGDALYKPKKLQTRDFARMMLHAYSLTFDLHHEHFTQKAPLPKDFMSVVKNMRLSAGKLDHL